MGTQETEEHGGWKTATAEEGRGESSNAAQSTVGWEERCQKGSQDRYQQPGEGEAITGVGGAVSELSKGT